MVHATCMVSVVHAYGFEPCWRHQRCLLLREAQGQVSLLPYPAGLSIFGSTFLQQWYILGKICVTVSASLSLESIFLWMCPVYILSVLLTVVVEYVHFNHGSSWHDLPYPPDAHGVYLDEDQY